jgi:DNA polymerase V
MEMTDAISLDLVEKRLVTNQLILTIGFDRESLERTETAARYKGNIATDYYGRTVPKHAHGTANLNGYSSSSKEIIEAVMSLYDNIVDHDLLIRRLNITTNNIISETEACSMGKEPVQLDLFTDYEALAIEARKKNAKRNKERKMQEALIAIKHKFGKNAILKGTSFSEGATARDRNNQIGGHKA